MYTSSWPNSSSSLLIDEPHSDQLDQEMYCIQRIIVDNIDAGSNQATSALGLRGSESIKIPQSAMSSDPSWSALALEGVEECSECKDKWLEYCDVRRDFGSDETRENCFQGGWRWFMLVTVAVPVYSPKRGHLLRNVNLIVRSVHVKHTYSTHSPTP